MEYKIHQMISERIQTEQFVFDHVTEHGYGLLVPHELLREDGFQVFRVYSLNNRVCRKVLRVVQVDEFILQGGKESTKRYRKDNRKEIFFISLPKTG